MAGQFKYDWAALRPDILAAAEQCQGDVGAVAKTLGVPASSLRHAMSKDPALLTEVTSFRTLVRKTANGRKLAEKPGTRVKGDQAEIVTEPAPDLGDVEALIRERGLDPADWEVKSAILNEWDSNAGGGQIIKLRQLKIQLVRRVPIEFIRPAVGIRPHKIVKATRKPADWISVLFPDRHAPYHDPALHDAAMRFIAKVEPAQIVDLGDLGDYAQISKHRDNPAWSASTQESIDGSGRILSDQRSAAPGAEMVLLEGNHDWRLATELLLRAERMYGIKPASIPGHENDPQAFSLRYLLHLDELDIKFIQPEREGDNYNHAEFWITDSLVAIHGDKSKRAAKAEAEKVGASVVCGHTHRQTLDPVSLWSRQGRRQVLAMECGTMRAIDKSAGFVKRPDWHPGFGVASIFADGSHDLEAVRWDGKHLTWRGERW